MQLNVREVAEIFEVPESQVYRWVQKDDMPSRQANDHLVFNRTELLEWATVRKIRFLPNLLQEPGTPVARAESLAVALEAGGVIAVPGRGTKAEVLREVTRCLPLPEGCDRELLLQLFLARESAGSTAVGDGIAIPHPRRPVVLAVNHPVLTICFLDAPVEFGASDSQPVHTLFVLVNPTIRSHLSMLARVACVLRDPAFRALLLRRAPVAELLREMKRIEAAFDLMAARSKESA
jgi:nitrogen PTS system EIIA component